MTSGSPASSSSAGASSRSGRRRVSVGPCSAMLALLFDIHGNLPALEAVLDDARAAGASSASCSGGDYAVFGGWPAETVDAPARAARRHLDPRQRRALGGRPSRPTASRRAAASRAAAALMDAATDRRARRAARERRPRPRHARLARLAEVRPAVLLARARRRRARAARGRRRTARLVFGHIHVLLRPPRRARDRARRPRRVGIPLDGDHRAAYALMHDDGRIERRRVDYDQAAQRRARARGRRRRPVGRHRHRADRARRTRHSAALRARDVQVALTFA